MGSQPSDTPQKRSNDALKGRKWKWSLLGLAGLTSLAWPVSIQLTARLAGVPAADVTRGTQYRHRSQVADVSGLSGPTSVIANSPQNGLSFVMPFDFPEKLAQLIGEIPENGSLEDAVQRLQQTGFSGYPLLTFYPLRSGSPVAGWRVQDRTTPRLLLMVYQDNDPWLLWRKPKVEKVAQALQKRFGIPDDQLIMGGAKNSHETRALFLKLRDKINAVQRQHPEQLKPEVFILLTAHGTRPEKADDLPEGEAFGKTTLFSEAELDGFVSPLAIATQSMVVAIDSCHSGAFSKID
jgi:hypothetical protein